MTISESTMYRYWVAAVRAKYHNKCALCNNDEGLALECHHVIKRSKVLTRWDHRNGILLCIKCHGLATDMDPLVLTAINAKVDLQYLAERSRITSKQYFADHSITRGEWYEKQLAENKAIAQGVGSWG